MKRHGRPTASRRVISALARIVAAGIVSVTLFGLGTSPSDPFDGIGGEFQPFHQIACTSDCPTHEYDFVPS